MVVIVLKGRGWSEIRWKSIWSRNSGWDKGIARRMYGRIWKENGGV